MTSRDFCYWLQGFFELAPEAQPHVCGSVIGMTVEQAQMVKRHLALVFKHEIDPSAGPPEVQEQLNAIHDALQQVKDRPPVVHANAGHGLGPVFRC